jgi:DNA-binding phage protein
MHKKTMEHEEAMEEAKHMLDKGIGMGEIKENTGLNEENIRKAKHKMNRK